MNIDSMALSLPEVERHPNRAPFRGVLTLVDAPSDQPPSGARGHRVLLTRAAAEAALPSLLGMGLDYAPTLDRHDARRKVGIITAADIVGNHIEVAGILFARDFPDVVREIGRPAASRQLLGMSYEITDARIDDPRAGVWTVTEFTFTGAAVLRRDKAAYRATWFALD